LYDGEVSSNVVYQRGAETAWRTIVGETIVVHLGAKEFFGLNEPAADVWLALDGTADLEALSSRLGIAEQGVASFCSELLALGLVEIVEEGDASSEGSRTSAKPRFDGPPTGDVDPPCIVWREEMSQVAASCALIPATNPICNQAPES
jgi:hypothetical protein